MKKGSMNFVALVLAMVASLVPAVSMAAVDAGITTAISTAQTDGMTIAGLLTTLAVVVWGALYIKRKFFG